MKILLTGAKGLVGKNFVKLSRFKKYLVPITREDLDLENSKAVKLFFKENKFDVVIHLAAKVGGINANMNNKLIFFESNLVLNFNVVKEAVDNGVEYLMVAGTGCAYPKALEGKVLQEEYYLEGSPEPTNDAYAYAKRAMLCHLEAAKESKKLKFSYFLPANIYGPYDNFSPTLSHVIPGLISRMHNHKKGRFLVWGSGSAKRDFLYISDLVNAMDLMLEKRLEGVVNIGTSTPVSIAELAYKIRQYSRPNLDIGFDTSMPDGQSVRIMDCSKIKKIGWKPQIDLNTGLMKTIDWFVSNYQKVRL